MAQFGTAPTSSVLAGSPLRWVTVTDGARCASYGDIAEEFDASEGPVASLAN